MLPFGLGWSCILPTSLTIGASSIMSSFLLVRPNDLNPNSATEDQNSLRSGLLEDIGHLTALAYEEHRVQQNAHG